MNSAQHGLIACDIAADQSNMLFACAVVFETVQGKLSPLCGKLGGCYKLN